MKNQEWCVQDLGAASEVLREQCVSEDGLEIGRKAKGMGCPDDPQMSARHARLFLRGGQAFIEESGATTGVWMRVRSGSGSALRVDDQIWLGAQILLIRKRAEAWEIRHHGPDGRLREKHLVPETGFFLGRASDLVLDRGDSLLSRRHAQIVREGESLQLYDRGAHNGTYLKLVEPVPLRNGDEFRIATHRFRIVAIPKAEPSVSPAAHTTEEPEKRRRTGLAARLRQLGRKSAESKPDLLQDDEVGPPADHFSEEVTLAVLGDTVPNRNKEPKGRYGSEVTLAVLGDTVPPGSGRTETPAAAKADADFEIVIETAEEGEVLSVPAAAGQTLLEAVQAAGLARGEPLDWECGDGGCGVCVMGLVGGAEGLEPPDPESAEMKTIQITEQVAPDPAKYRLACLARVRGNVRLRRL